MELINGVPIRVVERLTGITAHVIRAWEKRYGAVVPQRTSTNRRLYLPADVHRLMMLKQALALGYSISRVAGLSNDDLQRIVGDPKTSGVSGGTGVADIPVMDLAGPAAYLERAVQHVGDMDADGLVHVLSDAYVDLSRMVFLERLVVPLMHRIGELWYSGELRVSQEHLATSIVRSMLGGLMRSQSPLSDKHHVLVGTPAGQAHELGAMVVAVTTMLDGWRMTYLGPDLPAEEIATAAKRVSATVVALSLTYPADDAGVHLEIQSICRYLPSGVRLVFGGEVAASYAESIQAGGGVLLSGLDAFRALLREQS